MTGSSATALAAWSGQDTRIMLFCLVALAAIVVLISALKIIPFLSILIGSFVAGLGIGLPLEKVGAAFSKGAGSLLGETGMIIALGAMLGALMAGSGAADRIVDTLLRRSSRAGLPWMMALVAIIIGLPLFFEVGLVMMVPIIFVMARRSEQPILRIAIPALAGLTAMHALLPPHPGPLIAVTALHADLGVTMLFGLIAAIPAVILAGPLYGGWLARRMPIGVPEQMDSLFQSRQPAEAQPGFGVSLLTILLPVVLMLGRTVARIALPRDTALYDLLDFFGEPIVALTVTVLVAIVVLGWARGQGRDAVGATLRKALPIAGLLLTIGAGGGLKQVLLDAGISDTITKIGAGTQMPLILLAWLIAVALRQATGSATVATTATAGIVAPLAAGLGTSQGSLLALAIGAGSVFFCHVNDAGFWMVREYLGLNLRQTIMAWSVLQTIVSLTGLAVTLGLWRLVA
jgi:GntP family gluconate:H+ symporter